MTAASTLSTPENTNSSRKIRYAVVGLGWFAQAAALPAFAQAENSEVVALISDDPAKLKQLSQEYGIEHTYSYEEYETCLTSGEVDAVYIALPNHLHCEYTVRAANQAIHVLCEKPMAVTETECDQMIRACDSNGVKLMIAYRLHLEPANMKAVEIIQSGKIGQPRLFTSTFSQQVDQANIRVQPVPGTGPLYDIGIYCLNAARYLFQADPIEVFAAAATAEGDQRFEHAEEMVSVVLRFPEERLATFICSFGAASSATYQVVGSKGEVRLEPAYTWQGEIKQTLIIEGERTEQSFGPTDQIAAEFVYFSDCILQDKAPQPSGQEGRIDVHILRALQQSAEQNKPVAIAPDPAGTRPSAERIIQRPTAQGAPDLVHAASPGGE